MYVSKQKQRISLFLLTVLCIAKSSAVCKHPNDKEAVCELISDIKDGGLQPQYEIVRIESRSRQQLEENSFTNIPNVKKLSFNGALNKINRNSFNWLNNIEELQFFNNDLLELKSNVFANLPVSVILIYSSNVKKLRVRCFDNLPNLKRIFLQRNSISNIPAGVFSYTNTEALFLNENGIRTIEEEAFYGMNKLTKLALERNFLKSFNSNLYVGSTSPNLNLLWLARNNFTQITTSMLQPFPKLEMLLMNINNIETIEDGSFNFSANLRYIDLSNNKLENLSSSVFPKEGLVSMDSIFLHNNHLIHLPSDVLAKLPRLKKIAVGGNPWLCPCYHELKSLLQQNDVTLVCNDEYSQGERPVCVSPALQTDKCNPNEENVQSLFEIYYSSLNDYTRLPTLCKKY